VNKALATALLLAAAFSAVLSAVAPAGAKAEAPPAGGAKEGVYGRAALRGVVSPGLGVHAFSGPGGADPADEPVASTLTAQDGTYRLALPPGTYTMVARAGKAGERPRPGDPYCYYSGSPVTVRAGEWTPVGFNLVKVPAEERRKGDRSGIEGTVTYQDAPLERLYLTLYRDANDSFRGPGVATYPVGAGGRFSVGVPPGRYYLIARKRVKGGMYGPVEIGDHFNFYPGNPVAVGEKERVRVSIETVTRLSQLEEEGDRRVPRVTGRILDGRGKPVAGVRVFAYPAGVGAKGGNAIGPGEGTEGGKGRPLAFSPPSGADGAFALELPRDGLYTLIARERFGGPAAGGEWSGEYRRGEPLKVEGRDAPPVTLTVERAP
jgi:hypothetical protein